MGGRNFAQKPYSDDEKRVAHWFFTVAGVGGGDDPIGFMIISHETLVRERKDLKQQVAALQLDNDRLSKLMSFDVEDATSPVSRQMQALEQFEARGRNAQAAVDKILKKDNNV